MRMLIDTEKAIRESKILENDDPEVLLQRLRLAYWVAEHRITHGQYVLKAIYQTEPVGGKHLHRLILLPVFFPSSFRNLVCIFDMYV
jgi:hypothetical protein